jgi:hypothetical protein
MVFDDEEIKRSRTEIQAGSTNAQISAAERKRRMAQMRKQMLAAKRANDRRGFERLLDAWGVKRKTSEYDDFWTWFYGSDD